MCCWMLRTGRNAGMMVICRYSLAGFRPQSRHASANALQSRRNIAARPTLHRPEPYRRKSSSPDCAPANQCQFQLPNGRKLNLSAHALSANYTVLACKELLPHGSEAESLSFFDVLTNLP